MKTTEALAQSSPGRIVLHVLCLLRRPDRWAWHLHGIMRELVVASVPVSAWQEARFSVPVQIPPGGPLRPNPQVYATNEARPSVTFSPQSSADARSRRARPPHRPATASPLLPEGRGIARGAAFPVRS